VKSTIHAVVATAAILGALTACTSTSADGPPANTAPDGIPPITQPQLSLSVYAGKPCQLFGVDQLISLDVTEAGNPDAGEASRCRWTTNGAARTGTISVTLSGTMRGIDGVYAAQRDFPFFRPTEVSKYPAVNRDTAQGSTGTCATVVGIANGATFEIQVDVGDKQSAQYSSPCTVSEQAAAIAVGNLQGGG
jgi:hypothetical protein